MGIFRKLFGMKEPLVLRPAPTVITEEHIASVIKTMRVFLHKHGATQPARLMFVKQASSNWEEVDSLLDVGIRFVIEGVAFIYSESNIWGAWYITLNGQVVVSNDVAKTEG